MVRDSQLTSDERFEELMVPVQKNIDLGKGDKEYWEGFKRGLQRKFYGDKFVTDEEHKKLVESSGAYHCGYINGRYYSVVEDADYPN